jgi:hypothetical protein
MTEFVTGKVAFSCVTAFDEYMGESTGKYTLTILLDPEDAAKLDDLGVRLKDYEGQAQRKFTCKFDFDIWGPVVDGDKEIPFVGEIPRGSEVKVLYSLGPVNPQWGPSTFMNKVRVVSVGEREQDEVPDEF